MEEAHLAESMERLIMEAYKLLQQGDMQQAESLLQEGDPSALLLPPVLPFMLLGGFPCGICFCCLLCFPKLLPPVRVMPLCRLPFADTPK